MKRFSSAVLFGVLGFAWVGTALEAAESQSPYASIQDREIKTLSQEEIAGLEEGSGMGLALAAELNGYPGPKHVLELAEDLHLTENQLLQTQRVFDGMKQSAVDLGHRIVELEHELDDLFSSGGVDVESLDAQTASIAEQQGLLRATHLRAHLEMMEILSGEQVQEYIRLRGYHGGAHTGHHEAGDPRDHR